MVAVPVFLSVLWSSKIASVESNQPSVPRSLAFHLFRTNKEVCAVVSETTCSAQTNLEVSIREGTHSQKERRLFLSDLISSCCVVGLTNAALPHAAVADGKVEGSKPYAPLENLLPATRVRVLLDQAVDTASALVRLQKEGTPSDGTSEDLIAKLKSFLLEPQEFIKPEEALMSKRYLEQKTWGDWDKARRKETQEKFEIIIDPATRANEAFEQWGERRQFKRLRRQQLRLEKSNNMRAAFNAYTNNLVFSETYTLNASKEERSRLIRTYDQLPDVTSVVRSDLDLRDLYRNQVLTFTDDAKAELIYQLQQEKKFDATDLLVVLKQAQSSCIEWFKFVPVADAEEAMNALLLETNE